MSDAPNSDYYLLRARIVDLEAEVERLRRERDLAVAHDTQPYPTAHAYEQVCAALNRKVAENERLREKLTQSTKSTNTRQRCDACYGTTTGEFCHAHNWNRP